jgi:pyruvate kinase
MLSDETANGNYPLETVAAMKKVILYTQDHEPVEPLKDKLLDNEKHRDAISVAAIGLAKQLNAAVIIVETRSGATAANIATHRPNMPIISVTSEPRSAQQLALCYANRSYVRPDNEQAGFELARELKAQGYFGEEPVDVVIVSGQQPGMIGSTDTIKIRTI